MSAHHSVAEACQPVNSNIITQLVPAMFLFKWGVMDTLWLAQVQLTELYSDSDWGDRSS